MNHCISPCDDFFWLKCMKKVLGEDFRKGDKAQPLPGAKHPDDAIIDHHSKQIFIIEFKNQNVSGSVDEKILSGDSKRYSYTKQCNDIYQVHYIYFLSDFFKKNMYKSSLDNLDRLKIPYFFEEKKAENYIIKMLCIKRQALITDYFTRK